MKLVTASGGSSQGWKHIINRISLEEACSTTGSGTSNGQPYLGMLSSGSCCGSCVGRLKYNSDDEFDECLLFVCRVLQYDHYCMFLVQCTSAAVSSSPYVYHTVRLLGMALLGVSLGCESPTPLPCLISTCPLERCVNPVYIARGEGGGNPQGVSEVSLGGEGKGGGEGLRPRQTDRAQHRASP